MYTIAKAKEAIKSGVRGYLLKDKNGTYVMKEVNRLPFYLEGCPGIGKTEIVRQIAEELQLGYVSFSLVHHTRNSLLGLPVIKELESGDKYTCYTMSEIIAKVLEQKEAGYEEGILLLDEFPCMSETILPAMLSFLQTKNIGAHRLPEGWVIVLCGNPPAYNKTARTFDAAIMDRIRKLEIEFQPETFLDYAKEIGIHIAIQDYLSTHKQHVYRYKSEKKSQELVTCRGWENVSHMLKTYEALEQEVDRWAISQYIKSEEIAAEFSQFYEQYSLGFSSQTADDILMGIHTDYYINQHKNAALDRKWRMLEYLMDCLKQQMEEVSPNMELCMEAERVIAVLERLDKQQKAEYEAEEIDVALSEYVPMPAFLTIDNLKRDIKFSNMTEERQKLFDSWKEYAVDQSLGGSAVLLDGSLYERSIQSLSEYCDLLKSCISQEKLKGLAMKLTRILLFAEKIDQERSLLEMLFQSINNSKLFLMLLKEFPSQTYLDMCARRYAL